MRALRRCNHSLLSRRAGVITVTSDDPHWVNTAAGIPFTLGVTADHEAIIEVMATDVADARCIASVYNPWGRGTRFLD